jgi:hypothetical protein
MVASQISNCYKFGSMNVRPLMMPSNFSATRVYRGHVRNDRRRDEAGRDQTALEFEVSELRKTSSVGITVWQ